MLSTLGARRLVRPAATLAAQRWQQQQQSIHRNAIGRRAFGTESALSFLCDSALPASAQGITLLGVLLRQYYLVDKLCQNAFAATLLRSIETELCRTARSIETELCRTAQRFQDPADAEMRVEIKRSPHEKCERLCNVADKLLNAAAQHFHKEKDWYSLFKICKLQWAIEIQESSESICIISQRPEPTIKISEGCLDQLKSDDEVAWILAHEIAHVLCSDGLKRTHEETGLRMWEILYNTAFSSWYLVESPILAACIVGGMGTYSHFVRMKSSRDREYRADRMGMLLAKLAGFDQDKMANATACLESHGWTMEVVASHPSSHLRHENIVRPQLPKEALGTHLRAAGLSKNGDHNVP